MNYIKIKIYIYIYIYIREEEKTVDELLTEEEEKSTVATNTK